MRIFDFGCPRFTGTNTGCPNQTFGAGNALYESNGGQEKEERAWARMKENVR